MPAAVHKFYKSLFWLGETNLFISAAAACCTLATYAFYGMRPGYHLVGFVFFTTLFTYNLQRRIGEKDHEAKYYSFKSLFMAVGLAGALGFVYTLSFKVIVVMFFAGAMSFAYVLPLLRIGGKKFALRQIPYLKIWIIVLVWVLATAMAPLIEFKDLKVFDNLLSAFLFFLQQGCFILALTIPFDIRDRQSDYLSQHTLPMDIGVSRSIKVARRAMIACFVFAFLNYLIGFFAFPQMLAQLGVSILGYVVLRYGGKVQKPLYYLIVLDGMIVLQGIAVLVVSL